MKLLMKNVFKRLLRSNSRYSGFTLAIYVEGTPPPVPVPYWAIALFFVALGVGAYIAFKRKNLKQAI